MNFFPMLATGLVFANVEGTLSMSGTCFAYGSRNTLITAAHCVPDHVDDFFVLFPAEQKPRRVVEVRRAEIDLAVLIVESAETDEFGKQVYDRLEGNEALIDGGDFVGYGFPVEGGAAQAVGRTFKGHIMRHFRYDPPGQGGYLAVEMSIPAPGGFSGGPLCYTNQPMKPFAVVTGNLDSSVTVSEFEEVQKDGVVYREKVVRIISYGIGKLLAGSVPWLQGATK